MSRASSPTWTARAHGGRSRACAPRSAGGRRDRPGAGARDILDPRVELPRLVIVVDEFAALLGEHPELHAVFTDVAARGRALGMHLVLGTQRPAGVVRESLLANCPLRISLRVTDPADSRARRSAPTRPPLFPADASGRGLALVRRGGRRVAASRADRPVVRRATAQAIVALGGRPAPAPTMAARRCRRASTLEDLAALAGDAGRARSLLGLADEPDRQRQRPVGVRVARSRAARRRRPGGSGKSTALRSSPRRRRPPSCACRASGEERWDAVADLVERPPAPGTRASSIDDLDALAAPLPPDYARELVERLERVAPRRGRVRDPRRRVAPSGSPAPLARLADLLPRRLVLPTSSRAEHFAAGGDPAHYAPGAPPGRGRLDGMAVQVAIERPDGARPHAEPVAPWRPPRPPHRLRARAARPPRARRSRRGTARGIRVAHARRVSRRDRRMGDRAGPSW